MKKNIITYITAVLIVSLSASCEDFLNRTPISSITDEMLGLDPDVSTDSIKYNSAEQMEGLLTSAYRSFQTEFYQLDRYIIGDGQSDNAYSGEPKAQTMQIDQFTVDATNGNVSREWRYLYQQIASANSIIEWIDKNTDPNLSANRKKEILGEASFIRAVGYFYLVRIYGSVPLITKEVPAISNKNLDEVYPLLYPERKPVVDVYNLIISDLTTAINNCQDYSDFKFKITKPLANAVMAEVYAAKDAPANVNWTKVKEHASAVNNNPKYGLMPNFDDLWAAATDASGNKNEHCKESLFEVDCNSWATIGNWAFQMFSGTDWKKFNTPSKDLVSAFDAATDQYRKNASIMFANVVGKWSDQYWGASSYPFCNKLRVNEKGNIILWRLASNILLQAEAENELGNLNEAKTLLNKVRVRAGLTATTVNTKEDMRLALEKERRLELAFEGYRWFDLVRTGRAIAVMQACSDHQKGFAVRLNNNKLIWPVPQNELDQNDLLKQNEGY